MLSLDDRNHLTAPQVLESRTYFFQEVSVENAKNMKACEGKKTMNITVAYTKQGYSSMLSDPFATESSTNYGPHFTTFGELVAPVGISGPPENDHFTEKTSFELLVLYINYINLLIFMHVYVKPDVYIQPRLYTFSNIMLATVMCLWCTSTPAPALCI